jgi:hypothetical protein
VKIIFYSQKSKYPKEMAPAHSLSLSTHKNKFKQPRQKLPKNTILDVEKIPPK